MRFANRNDAKIWMIDNQMGRRNLADIDRIALARKREEILRHAAKGNQQKSNGRGKKGSAKSPNLIPVDVRKDSAARAGVGQKKYDEGKLVLDAVERGEIPASDVDDIRAKKNTIHGVAKKIKGKPKPTPKKGAMELADAAIKLLSRIDRDDPMYDSAMDRVAQWIASRR